MTPPKLYVFSGSGLSAESGISTFRGNDGTWSNFDINEVCNIFTWRKNREAIFNFYASRRQEYSNASFNAAHAQIATWQKRWGRNRVVLLTQNVDNLLEAAGAEHVTHLHGNINDLLCTSCGYHWSVGIEHYHSQTPCPKCRSLEDVKPGVILFHEEAPEYVHLNAMRQSIRGQDIVLVVGTALHVISSDKMLPTQRWGHPLTWQVNPKPAEPEYYGRVLAMGACEGIAQLNADIEATMSSSTLT